MYPVLEVLHFVSDFVFGVTAPLLLLQVHDALYIAAFEQFDEIANMGT